MSLNVARVALYGADNSLGAMFSSELQSSGPEIHVTILATSTSQQALEKQYTGNAQFTLCTIDLSDQPSIVKALLGQDLVLSTISGNALLTQLELIKAAELAGVKYFVPADYGPDIAFPSNNGLPLFATNATVQSALKSSTLNYMIVTSGFFADYYLTPLFGWSLDGAPTATVYGDDNAKNSFTSLGDIAKYTIAAIKRIDEFENQNLRLAAYTLSFVDWCNLVEQEAGTRVKVAEADLAPIIEAAKLDIDPPKDLEAIKRQMAIVLANGAGKVDWETHSLDNSKFPEITPAPIELVVKQALAKALK